MDKQKKIIEDRLIELRKELLESKKKSDDFSRQLIKASEQTYSTIGREYEEKKAKLLLEQEKIDLKKGQISKNNEKLDSNKIGLHQADKEKRVAQPHDQKRPGDVPIRHIGRAVHAQQGHEPDPQHAARNQVAPVELHRKPRHEWRNADRRDCRPCGGLPRVAGGVVHVGLQPERREHVERKDRSVTEAHGDDRRGKTAVTKDPQIDHGMLLGQFPEHESQEPKAGRQREGDDFRRGKPVELFAEIEHKLQRTHPEDEQAEADDIDRRGHQARLVAVEQPAGEDQAHHRQREVDVEDPRPGKRIA